MRNVRRNGLRVVIPITTDFARMRLNIVPERTLLQALAVDKILRVFSYTTKCTFFEHFPPIDFFHFWLFNRKGQVDEKSKEKLWGHRSF